MQPLLHSFTHGDIAPLHHQAVLDLIHIPHRHQIGNCGRHQHVGGSGENIAPFPRILSPIPCHGTKFFLGIHQPLIIKAFFVHNDSGRIRHGHDRNPPLGQVLMDEGPHVPISFNSDPCSGGIHPQVFQRQHGGMRHPEASAP